MENESEGEERSLYLQLLLGLLPFDVEITQEALKDLVNEADDTSWSSVMRRSANLGLVLSTLGIAGLGLLILYLAGFSNTPLEHLGAGYKVGVAIVLLMWIAKFLLGLLQNIDTGDSPLVTDEKSTLLTTFLEFVIGVSLVGSISIPLYANWNLDLLVGLLLALTAVGVGISGICLTIGGAHDFIVELTSTKENRTTEESINKESTNLSEPVDRNHQK